MGPLPWGDARENRGFHKGHSGADPYNQVPGRARVGSQAQGAGAGCRARAVGWERLLTLSVHARRAV